MMTRLIGSPGLANDLQPGLQAQMGRPAPGPDYRDACAYRSGGRARVIARPSVHQAPDVGSELGIPRSGLGATLWTLAACSLNQVGTGHPEGLCDPFHGGNGTAAASPVFEAGTDLFLGIVTSHCAAIFFPGSKSASPVGLLRNNPAPKFGSFDRPTRATETSARYGRGVSSRETERVRHALCSLFQENSCKRLLIDLASSFPHRSVITSGVT